MVGQFETEISTLIWVKTIDATTKNILVMKVNCNSSNFWWF